MKKKTIIIIIRNQKWKGKQSYGHSTISADHRMKIKKSEKRDMYLDLKKTVRNECDGDTSCNWCTWNDPCKLGNRAGRVGNRRLTWDHLKYNIVQFGYNTEKSPGDLRRLAFSRKEFNKTKKSKKYLDFGRELKRLWDIWVKLIPVIVDALRTTPRSRLKGLEEPEISLRIENI